MRTNEILVTLFVVIVLVSCVSWIAWGVFTLHDSANDSHQQRYFQCLDRMDSESCGKMFYKLKLKD